VPAQTRATLVEAATQLFLAQGVDAPSLDAICERAGYTRGAFYVHFGSREALLDAVVEKAMADFLDAMVGEGADVELPALVASFVGALGDARHPGTRLRASQVLEACARSPGMRVKYLALLVTARERIAETIRRSQSRGTLRADVRAEPLSELLLALVLGAQVAVQLEAPYDAELAAGELLRLVAPGREGEALSAGDTLRAKKKDKKAKKSGKATKPRS
jgi:AcrR family transcriptional regulator